MKENIQKKLRQWISGQQQFLFLSPLHLLLPLVVGALFILTFKASFASTAGATALKRIKAYLRQLLTLDPKTLVAKQESSRLEHLLNKVKISCEIEKISKDRELKDLLEAACNKINSALTPEATPERHAWRLFNASAREFIGLYFPETRRTYVRRSADHHAYVPANTPTEPAAYGESRDTYAIPEPLT